MAYRVPKIRFTQFRFKEKSMWNAVDGESYPQGWRKTINIKTIQFRYFSTETAQNSVQNTKNKENMVVHNVENYFKNVVL